MGEPGSGIWYRRLSTKTSVEQTLVLAVWDFRGKLYRGPSGTITWPRTDANGFSVDYSLTWGADGARTIKLQYRLVGHEEVCCLPIRLQATPTNFNGVRWWFTCPLMANGIACNRRAAKLYLPPGATYFGCRKCYDLKYQSCW